MVRQPSTTTLLASAVVSVYALVVVGATAALADAAAACSGWPTCAGPIADPAVLVVLLHRAAAALVGLLIVALAVFGWSDLGSRARAALAVALVLYPVQAGFGALVANGVDFAGLHLLVGMAIFGSLVLALAWHLETETGSDDAPGAVPEPDLADEPVGPAQSPDLAGIERAKATAWAYFQLMKPRLMWLLCLVAGAGMALAGTPTIRTVVATLGGGVLAIGASGTYNHVLERDIDQRMERTADRPVATHRVPVRNALAFGGLLTVASLAAFLSVNLLTAALGLAAIVFYSVVYTLVLKPNTVQNTVIGGAAGALPALIGYAAVTGTFGLPGAVLALVIFLWTPAHFYNLALAYRDDYERGGFPMMPVVRGETETRKHIVLYLGATLLGASALTALTDLGWLYAVTTVALGAVFLWTVVRLHREQTESAAFRAFHASNAYLGLLLVAVVVDALAF
ncbi:protoheme IX farnesyltransferase [Natronomonas salina]|uniref:heme o synthase n=1 Tax=Natronomonas salina TaxID=1710540 RepID=UPI0015B3BA34|nr:heme o synthase [Natronomonas salina]QLD88413.1 protoheme IX farnesyltransferase [Natronomonas salina]